MIAAGGLRVSACGGHNDRRWLGHVAAGKERDDAIPQTDMRALGLCNRQCNCRRLDRYWRRHLGHDALDHGFLPRAGAIVVDFAAHAL